MDIKEAQGQFESGRTVVIGNPSSHSETGEPYVCICSGGPKQEGEPMPALYSTPELAVSEWLRAVRNYAVGRRGTLYWRHPPIIEGVSRSTVPGLEDERWAVYSRLLISDKPALEVAA